MTNRSLIATLALLAPLPLLAPRVLTAQNVAEVQVAPPSVTIRVGERTGLLATAFDRIGNVIPTVRLIWSSNNVNIAKVDNNGTVTGVGNGVAIIEARAGARRGQAAIQVVGGGAVSPPPPGPPPPPTGPDLYGGQPPGSGPAAALRLEPGVIYLLPSENTRVSPRALKEDGSAAAPVNVNWTSLRTDVASVDQSGNVVALAPGQGTIQATAPGGLTATAPVVVQQADFTVREAGAGSPLMLSPGDLDTLHVIVAAQNNRTVNPLVLQWASNDQSVARVSLAGVVTAAGPGKATLSVSGLLQNKSIEVSVHKVVDKLSVRPPRAPDVAVPLTGTAKFDAQALTADNTPVPEAPLRWSVADPAIASFDPQTGMLTGRAVGKTQFTVKGPGVGLAVTWNINVIAGSVRFVQPRVGIGLNQRHTLHANYADDQGNVLGAATNLTWSTDNPQVATVGEDGTVAGAGFGHARVTAAAPGGKTAAADIYVVGEIVVASSRAGQGKFQLYSAERSNLAQLSKVTPPTDTASANDPAFSPDGSRIAFVTQRDGNPEIYVMNADGTGVTRVTNDPQVDGRPAFTPDGQSIVFHSSRPAGKQEIWAVNLDGTGLTQLTRDSINFSPAVSPDGQTIAYVSVRDKNYDIWLMGRDGSNQRAFTRTPQQKESEPHFLRDGTLAYLVERKEGNRTVQQVVRADLTTGSITPLTGTDLAIASFAISPSGDLVALVVNAEPQNRRNPAYRVYMQPVSSGTPVPMPTTGAEQMITPTFRP